MAQEKKTVRSSGWGAVRKLPSGRFQARFQDPRTGLRGAAPRTFTTRAEAARWLAGKQTDLERGVAIDERARTRPLREWWPGYIHSVETRLRPATASLYRLAWTRIDAQLGHVPVGRISPSIVDAFVADLVHTGLSASKVRETVGVLRRVLDLVVADSALPRNPCAERRLPLPRIEIPDRPMLSIAEMKVFTSSFPRDADRGLVAVMAYGGLRVGEALALQRRDLDHQAGQLHVRRSVSALNGLTGTKTHRDRVVVLPEEVVAVLRRQLTTTLGAHDGPLFPNTRGTVRAYRNFRRDTWDPALARYNANRHGRGLPPVDLTPHDLRAICASLLVDAGASIKDVQAHLGHADVTTTLRIYTRINPDKAQQIAVNLGALLAHDHAAEAAPQHVVQTLHQLTEEGTG